MPCIGVQSFRWALDNNCWQGRVGTIQAAFDAAAKDAGVAKPDAKFVKNFYARVVPGIDGEFDGPKMLPLIAPRPLLVINGDSDEHTPLPGVEECVAAAKQAYVAVGDISAVSVHGLEGAEYLNFAEGDNGVPRPAESFPITINRETNRTYCGTTAAVEVRDENLKRTIRVEKSGSQSTVVWNPWTTQKLPDDFDPAEHQHMICVESGNVKQDKISLAPGKATALKVVLSSY